MVALQIIACLYASKIIMMMYFQCSRRLFKPTIKCNKSASKVPTVGLSGIEKFHIGETCG